jgi:hypothetical protein
VNKVPSWPSAWSIASAPTSATRTVVSCLGHPRVRPALMGEAHNRGQARRPDPTSEAIRLCGRNRSYKPRGSREAPARASDLDGRTRQR